MPRLLDFRSWLKFLGRNRLYTAINVFGLSISLMFVVLIADYTLRQFTVDAFHEKADRIFILGNEGGMASGYYLQKYLLDRYPEIEMTCAISPQGLKVVEAGDRKLQGTLLTADTTFFRMFDFPIVSGDREQALAARNNVVLSESFARRIFGTFNPLGQTLKIADQPFTVSAVVRDIDRSVIHSVDFILCGEWLPYFNPSNNEYMSNAGGTVTFVLEREGADLGAKIPDMVDYFKEFYWIYQGNACRQVTLTPIRKAYFSPLPSFDQLNRGSFSFVMILFGVGAIILIFAVINYINLTVAQTGFRSREMAARRLLGATKGEVIVKLILESTLICIGAFIAAFLLAAAGEPYAAQLLESRISVFGDLTPALASCYVLFILLLGVVSGVIPAMMVARYKPIDIVRGTLRYHTKMVYSRILIAVQSILTIVLIASSFAFFLQIRHLIEAPLGYNTEGILHLSTRYLDDYPQIRRFREELLREPCVEAVALGVGVPIDWGENITISYGPDRMVSFQMFVGDSVYFRMLGFERLRDNRTDGWYFNEHAFRELNIPEDATHVKLGRDLDQNYQIAGVCRDFQIGSALDPPKSVMLLDIGDFDRYWRDGRMHDWYPWDILIKIRGDLTEAFAAVRGVFEGVNEDGFFEAAYLEEKIAEEYAVQLRTLRIVGIFTFVAILISALGLLAMSTFYIQQKKQEVAVRKVFGSTRREILVRLVGAFMRIVGVAFVVAVPVAWWLLNRWLQDYSVRIPLRWWIFAAAGVFAAVVAFMTVYLQSSRAADADPVDALKN